MSGPQEVARLAEAITAAYLARHPEARQLDPMVVRREAVRAVVMTLHDIRSESGR